MYIREILETTDEFWCVSNFIRDQTNNTLNKFQLVRTTKTWHNGVDLTRFGHSTKSENIYNKVGFTPDDFICIFTGRIIPSKGIREILSAFRYLSDYPNIKLLILGSPSFAEKTKSEFNSEIQKLCSELKDKVKFSGYIPYDEIHKYYAISDIAVLPSTWNEPFPLTCLEAMASKLPIITTNTGGIVEAVSEDCAIILEKGQGLIADIAKAIITLYEDPERRERMKEHAFNRSQLFSCKVFFDTFTELNDTSFQPS
jgi:glycosyltransferase involved in cell wall biosynthesis